MTNSALQTEGLTLEEIQAQLQKLKEAEKAAKKALIPPKEPTFNSVYKCVDKEGKQICDCPGLIGRAGMTVYCGKHQSNKLAMQPCIEEKTFQIGNRKKKGKGTEKISGLEFENDEINQKIELIPFANEEELQSPSMMIE